jgi:serine protease Do
MIRKTLRATQLATYSIDLPDPHRNGLPTPRGTGFFVSPDGWFITAAHVITADGRSDGPPRADLDEAWLMKESRPEAFSGGMCQMVTLDYVDAVTDFALLKVDFKANANKEHLKALSGFPYIEVSGRELEEGEPVYAFGYPLSQSHSLATNIGYGAHSPRVTSAIVASTMDSTTMISTSNDPRVYVLDKPLNYGNSGGPIIATESGRVHAFCSRFQPVHIRQNHLRGTPLITIPSLYGVVSSLGNRQILDELRRRGVSFSMF